MAIKVHTLAWHKTQFDHSQFKTKSAIHKEAQRRRNEEVEAKKAEGEAKTEKKLDKKRKRNNRRYRPKYVSMAERRYMVQVEHTHRWCGGPFHMWGCKGTGIINGMRHAPCKGNGIIRIRQVGRKKPQQYGNVTPGRH